MISIIDYGLGNIRAFANVYERLDIPVEVAGKPKDIAKATKLILPGVGAFDQAMQMLENSGLRKSLDEAVLRRRIPVIGICVGMQILGHSSEEGNLSGLGWIDGEVKKFKSSVTTPPYLPHMGWNNARPKRTGGLFQSLETDAQFYFLHTYYFQCVRNEDIIAETDYYGKFASAVNSGNVFGVQFHPEKSHQWGIQLLKNFAEL